MRCVLIYNPASGRQRARRLELLQQVVEVLSALGHQAELIQTTGAGSAGLQARKAIEAGAEIIFACGGDGTVHEVMQGLVTETGESRAALGILPLGSANALARHLKLSLKPAEAALQQIRGTAVAIPVGKLTCDQQVRYFVVMAGAGPDGALVYNLAMGYKSGLGRLAYYVHAARLFATQYFRSFEVAYTETSGSQASTMQAVCAMSVRVSNLGGLFGRLTRRRVSLSEDRLQLLIVRPPAILSLPLWFVCGWLHLQRLNPFLRRVEAKEFSCRGESGTGVHVEADGEWIGRLPVQVSLISGALRLLIPDLRCC